MHYTVKVGRDIWAMENKVWSDNIEGSTQNVSHNGISSDFDIGEP